MDVRILEGPEPDGGPWDRVLGPGRRPLGPRRFARRRALALLLGLTALFALIARGLRPSPSDPILAGYAAFDDETLWRARLPVLDRLIETRNDRLGPVLAARLGALARRHGGLSGDLTLVGILLAVEHGLEAAPPPLDAATFPLASAFAQGPARGE